MLTSGGKTMTATAQEKKRKSSSMRSAVTTRMLVHAVVVIAGLASSSSSSSSLFLNGNHQLLLLPLVDGFVLSPTPRVLSQSDLHRHRKHHHHHHSHNHGRQKWQSNAQSKSLSNSGRRRNTQQNSVIAGGIMQAVDTLWKANPYAAAAIVCGVKASAADFVAQKRQNRKKQAKTSTETDTTALASQEQTEENDSSSSSSNSEASSRFDRRRNLGFLIYGSAYQGVGQEYIYNTLYPIMFGTGGDPITVVKMVCFDLFIQTTFVTLPIAYYFKSIIFGTTFVQSTKQYLSDVRHQGLLTKYFMLWGPVQALTFGVIPHHFRITFIAMVSFFWVIILSTISGRQQSETPAATDTTLVKEDPPAAVMSSAEITTKTADREMVPSEI